MSDVLDSPEVASDFEDLYKEAILSPEEVESRIERLEAELRQRIQEVTAANRLWEKTQSSIPGWWRRFPAIRCRTG